MQIKPRRLSPSALVCAVAALLPYSAQAQFSVSAGADYSTGKFGGSTATDVWNVPLVGRWDSGALTLKLTVPWIRITNAGGVIPVLGNGAGEHGGAGGDDRGGGGGSGSGRGSTSVSGSGSSGSGSGGTVGQFGCAFDNRKGATKVENNGPCAGFTTGVGGAAVAPASRRTESGLGDAIVAATYNFYDNKASGIALDVTGRVKLPTASQQRGLGSGKTDAALQLDANRDFQRASLFGTVGYKWLGKPEGVDLKNVLYGSLGASYKVTDAGSFGAAYDFASAALAGASRPSEMSVFFTQKFSRIAKLNVYVLKGLSNGSPDWGGGIKYTYLF